MDFKEFIIKSFKKLNKEIVYDVDNGEANLISLGFKLDNTKKPDLIIVKDDYTILIELKELIDKEEDKEKKKELNKRYIVSYWMPDLFKKILGLIKEANRQFKDFINYNEVTKRDFITLVLIRCNRFTSNNTIADIEKYIHGEVIMTFNSLGDNECKIRNKILKRDSYTHSTFIGVWNGIDKFNIYHNKYYKYEYNSPVFITKNDVYHYLLEDAFEGEIRLKKYRIETYNGKEEITYLVDEQLVKEEELQSYLVAYKEKLRAVKKEQIKILNKR